nr:cell division cycle 6 [Crypthecodinium cohnii]
MASATPAKNQQQEELVRVGDAEVQQPRATDDHPQFESPLPKRRKMLASGNLTDDLATEMEFTPATIAPGSKDLLSPLGSTPGSCGSGASACSLVPASSPSNDSLNVSSNSNSSSTSSSTSNSASASPSAPGMSRPASLPYPLVGREKECKALDEFLEKCLAKPATEGVISEPAPAGEAAAASRAICETPAKRRGRKMLARLDSDGLPDKVAKPSQSLGTVVKSPGCLYVSGGPGTGKTCSVRGAAANWKQTHAAEKTEILEINCLKLSQLTPVEFLMQLGVMAEARSGGFPDAPLNRSATLGALRAAVAERLAFLSSSIIIVADEVDNLLGKKSSRSPQSKLEAIFGLISEPNAPRIALIAIANSVDLLQRAEVFTACQSILFEAYSKEQLRAIFEANPPKAGGEQSEKEAKLSKMQLELKIRQVAGSSGDFRKMVSLCQAKASGAPEPKTRTAATLNSLKTLDSMPLENQVLLGVLAKHKGSAMPFPMLMDKFKAALKALHMGSLQLGRAEVRQALSFFEVSGLAKASQKPSRGPKKPVDELTVVNLLVCNKAVCESLVKTNPRLQSLLA